MNHTMTLSRGNQTFRHRTKCKFCKSGPTELYYLFNKLSTTRNVLKFREIRNFSTWKDSDFYTEYSVKNRIFSPSYIFDSEIMGLIKATPPALRYRQQADGLLIIFECNCGKSSWAYNPSIREHIKNRKFHTSMSTRDALNLLAGSLR